MSHKQPVIIIKMRANMRSPECVPHVKPYLKTQKTDTSFAQNNIKSDSLGMCSITRPGSSICTYRTIKYIADEPQRAVLTLQEFNTKYYMVKIGEFKLPSITSLGLMITILNRNLEFIEFTCSHGVLLR